MEVCESGHRPIAYTTRFCPVCEARETIDNLEADKVTLDGEKFTLEEEIAELKSTIDTLKNT